MLRRFSSVLAALSLLLCVAAAVLWVRSHFTLDSVTFRRERPPVERHPVNGIPVPRKEPFYDFVEVDAYRGRLRLALMELESQSVFFWRPPPRRWDAYPLGSPQAQQVWDLPFQTVLIDQSWSRWGFDWTKGRSEGFFYYPMLALTIPLWSVAVPAAVLPSAWLARRLRRGRRSRRGLCPACGYDLQASTDRCPECGTPVGRTQTVG